MLFYLLITFQIFYFISCDISCYNTPPDENIFDYIVTPNHFPAELQNSSLDVNSSNCFISVLWGRHPDITQITLTADNNLKAGSTQQQLEVSVGYVMEISSSPTWVKSIFYQCNTDQCNSLSQLKRLLQALIVNESLHDLVYLLKQVKPFHGEWCYRGTNATFVKCNTTIPVSLCTECETIGIMNQTGTELCATCSTADPNQSLFAYQKIFNITDRTYSNVWQILCGRKNCNTPAVGESIRKKSYIDFNFATFLNNKIDA